jgi:D-glycero-alpha-D-manno-heptose 1-phosphate guanylyltransferase
MEAIVLAGGFGTRLRSVVGDRPKPMALLGDRPFLALLLDRLANAGFTRVILGVGFLANQISDYFGNHYAGMDIIYSLESEPLGTGGALRLAFGQVLGDEVFALNGDTFCDVNYTGMVETGKRRGSDIVIAVKHLPDTRRYGTVIVKDGYAEKFEEKTPTGPPGYINVGTYLIRKPVFPLFNREGAFSLENDLLVPRIKELHPAVFSVDGYFIDIGVPEDYMRAQTEMRGVYRA